MTVDSESLGLTGIGGMETPIEGVFGRVSRAEGAKAELKEMGPVTEEMDANRIKP